ncbi:MAG: tRNA dihydrouridine synthase DusB [Clostridiales bacterium]|nr:tRNA dihydrouridine synthase DusB [Clostridiales bacterium]
MKIGKIELKHGLFLAPMAGVSDAAFRRMCKKYGAEMVCTEMISSRALCYNDKKTKELAVISEDERPCALQIFGNDPEIMAKSALIALEFSPDAIDINMGCPAPKIAGNGDGSALMRKPALAYEIVKCVKEALEGKDVPLTVKIRSGWDEKSKNAPEIASLCEKAGADAITVHGRTKDRMYAPPADLDIIREVKKSVGIPVIANGNINDAKSALEMFEYTDCDGIMIGRAALGNPYIFKEITCALENKEYKKPSRQTVKADIKEHITALVELKGEFVGAREARKHVAWYLKGMPGAPVFRNEVNAATSLKEIKTIIDKAFN